MIIVGIDAHKDTYTLVAVDAVGKRQAVLRAEARAAGHEQILAWLEDFGDVVVAVEDCRHLTRALEASPLIAGHQVVRVHTRLMAGMRRSSRERGKSDPIDAESLARVALREDGLPTARLAGPDRDLKLFSDHRKRLVEHRTGLQVKLRWFLHELNPDLDVPSRGMRRYNSIEKQLAAIVQVEYPTLLAVPGMGALGAASIVGETAGVTRFSSKHAFARFNGTAPVPVWSGNTVRVRLSRGGNRRINTALHMAALTQQRLGGQGADYLNKQLAAGKTRVEATRLLRRGLSDRIYNALRKDEAAQSMDRPTQLTRRPLRLTAPADARQLQAA